MKRYSKKLHHGKLIIRYKEKVKKSMVSNLRSYKKRKTLPAIISKKDLCKKKKKKKKITDIKSIAENFHKYFTEIEPILAKKVGFSTVTFD